jgi:4-hydroxybenzoate polyprenyltransferase
MASDWIALLRPRHWVKNLFVLAPLLFALHLFDGLLWWKSLFAFGVFCVLASAVYAFNDGLDAERDRAHPGKRHRPVAAGRIRPRAALLAGGLLGALGLGGGLLLGLPFASTGLVYLAINAAYSSGLKRVAFLDVLCIAVGFVLRVVGGALAIEAPISPWLVACTFGLACLLGFGKRLHELESLGADSRDTRPALRGYTRRSLRLAAWLLLGVTLAAYASYTVAPGTLAKFGSYRLLFSVPFPLIGMLRFLQLVDARRTATPTEALVTDWPSWLNLNAWLIAVVLALYC